jgi:hypothetical protein
MKRGAIPGHAYISVSWPRAAHPDIWVSLNEHLWRLEIAADDGPAIILNLTKVVEELSAAAVEEGA